MAPTDPADGLGLALGATIVAGLTAIALLAAGYFLPVWGHEEWTSIATFACGFAVTSAVASTLDRSTTVVTTSVLLAPSIALLAGARWYDRGLVASTALVFSFPLALLIGFSLSYSSDRVRGVFARCAFGLAALGTCAALLVAAPLMLRPTPEQWLAERIDAPHEASEPTVHIVSQTTRSACTIAIDFDGRTRTMGQDISDEAGCSLVARADSRHGVVYLFSETNVGGWVLRRTLDARTLDDVQDLSPASLGDVARPWWGWFVAAALGLLAGGVLGMRALLVREQRTRAWMLAAATLAALGAPLCGWAVASA